MSLLQSHLCFRLPTIPIDKFKTFHNPSPGINVSYEIQIQLKVKKKTNQAQPATI
jgi:hypothetical protein